MCACACERTRACVCMRGCARIAHASTHAYTHVRTPTHTRTHAHTHRLEEEQKNHAFSLQQLLNTHAQKLASINQNVNIERAKLDAEATRYEIEMDEQTAKAESDRRVKTENARGQMQVREIFLMP